jgi:hypothetical protein
VTCQGCGAALEQPVTGRRRRYCSNSCKQRRYRFRNARGHFHRHSWYEQLIEEVELAVTYASGRTYGGHHSGQGTSVAEACRNSQELDRRLTALLGGIPQPHRRGTVVELPIREHNEEAVLVAA